MGLVVIGAGAGLVATGCGGEQAELTCTDTSGLPPADLATRQTLEYVDRTPFPEKRCDNCRFFQAVPNQCGACQLVKGPINPAGYCKSWVAKT